MPTYSALANFPPLTGSVVASTAALVDITPVPAFTIAANQLTAGSTWRVTAEGRYTCGTTATNCLIGLYYGGTGGTLLAGTLSTQALTVSQTNAPWRLEYTFTVRTLGATGSLWGQGIVFLGSSVSAWSALPIPSTANAAVTVDTTTSKTLNIGATLSQVTGAPTITCDHVLVENLTS